MVLDLITLIPLKDSCVKVVSFERDSCTLLLLMLMNLLSIKIKYDKNGRGIIVYNVKLGDTLIMYEIIITNKAAVFIVYIKAGPTYILTLLTSSLILFIKSPVLFTL